MERFDPYHEWLGIPAKDQPPHAYRLLGVELFEDNPGVIESAAEQRMLLLRTRQNGIHSTETQRLLNDVAQARRLLLEPIGRAIYDDQLRAQRRPPVMPMPLPPASRKAPSSTFTPRITKSPQRRQRIPPSRLLLVGGVASAALMALIVATLFTLAGGGPEREVAQSSADRAPAVTKVKQTTPLKKPLRSQQGFALRAPREVAMESSAVATDLPTILPAEEPEVAAVEPIVETAVVEENVAFKPVVESIEEVPPQHKELLTPTDLQYLGAFTLPREACGASTGYATGCLALRKVNGSTHLFCDSHLQTGGAIYEIEVPTPSKQAPYPTAKIVKEWGEIYQSRKHKESGESYELSGTVPTTGLRWDEARQGLWWVYGETYNTENQAAPTFGFTRIEGDKLIAAGPWRLTLSQSWQRGGTLEIPKWFADQHTGGKQLGVGFGGYYSIFEGGSYGPTLSAVSAPVEGRQPTHQVLLAHPDPHPAERKPNYQHATPGWMGRDPVGGKGTWSASDEIGGEGCAASAVWIDAPTKHGLLFFASLGTGRIAYEEGGIKFEKREDALYVYDPADLARVAQKKLQPWQPVAKQYDWQNPAEGFSGRAAGVAYDAATRQLFVLFVNAYVDGEEAYPVVVVYQI